MTPARLSKAISVSCGGLAAAIGLAAVVSWFMGRSDLFALLPGWPPIVANTAVMLAASGAALAVLAAVPDRTHARPAARVLSGFVLAVAAATALEYVSGVDLRIDQFLVRAPSLPTVVIPGRPSPHTASAFMALASALLALAARKPARRKLSSRLGALAMLIALVAILGHLFQAEARYGSASIWPHNQMAFLTAIMLMVLGAGVAAARPHDGAVALILERGAGGVAARRMLLGLALLAPVVVLLALGARLGWYSHATAAAGIVFAGLGEALTFILVTVRELNRLDVVRRRHEERIEQLVEQASDGIFIADIDGRYTDVNEAGARMLGYGRDQIIGKTILDLIPAEDAARLWESRTAMLSGRVHLSEWSLKKADGSFLPVEISAKILADGRWQGIVRDITERRRAQTLREAVISMTSHELGNPLSTVALALNMVANDDEQPLSPRQKEIVELARGAVKRMVRMVSDFLTVEKLATGALDLKIEQVDLLALVHEAASSMEPIARESKVHIQFDPSSRAAVVSADADRLTQVLVNLISNAIKFSPKNGRVEVKVAVLGDRVRVTVADEGPGIPEEFRSRIFGRFERAAKNAKSGSGLGLNISKAIIDALGGRIGFESRPRGGTVFFFELQAVRAPAAVQSLPKAK